MKVLVVGFPKTGTKSLNAALTILGYNIYDYDRNFYYLGKQWIKIFNKGGTKKDFYEMYKDVDGSVDNPGAYFWEEILEAFPDCKLIFMRKKSDKEWIDSVMNQLKAINSNHTMKMMTFFSPTAYRFNAYSHQLGRVIYGGPRQWFWLFSQNISPAILNRVYKNHNASVLMTAPKDNLLQYSVSEGWEPLCKFLEKPVPNAAFPYKNKNNIVLEELLQESPVFARMKRETVITLSLLVGVLSVLVFYYVLAL